MQESLEEGCKNVDGILASFGDVALKDRTMVWNTDLVEVCEVSNCLANVVVINFTTACVRLHTVGTLEHVLCRGMISLPCL